MRKIFYIFMIIGLGAFFSPGQSAVANPLVKEEEIEEQTIPEEGGDVADHNSRERDQITFYDKNRERVERSKQRARRRAQCQGNDCP